MGSHIPYRLSHTAAHTAQLADVWLTLSLLDQAVITERNICVMDYVSVYMQYNNHFPINFCS